MEVVVQTCRLAYRFVYELDNQETRFHSLRYLTKCDLVGSFGLGLRGSTNDYFCRNEVFRMILWPRNVPPSQVLTPYYRAVRELVLNNNVFDSFSDHDEVWITIYFEEITTIPLFLVDDDTLLERGIPCVSTDGAGVQETNARIRMCISSLSRHDELPSLWNLYRRLGTRCSHFLYLGWERFEACEGCVFEELEYWVSDDAFSHPSPNKIAQVGCL